MSEYRYFNLKICRENEAVQNRHNLASMLHEIAGRIDQGEMSGPVRDVNGNTCGRFWHGKERG